MLQISTESTTITTRGSSWRHRGRHTSPSLMRSVSGYSQTPNVRLPESRPGLLRQDPIARSSLVHKLVFVRLWFSIQARGRVSFGIMENSVALKCKLPAVLASSKAPRVAASRVNPSVQRVKPSVQQRRKGRRHCNICGNGKIVPCGKCRGRGESNTPYLPFSVDPVKKPCPACQGRGWFPCPDCHPPPSQ
ncbi:uncharacterized protein LOC112349716 [Selaginella moellendorffii]|uniref:uncharacterized protein LOC112349716 n=1 Tax=Selaginella moellendorffii TaxID=88036 RepID=UPI000D1C6296|nr:uncharacterized protein LOC112349716 [Selaginella moellendorffii]|eukprot:XP_024540404.1 uncharacterized protein LOC112349716 [Selaginella moellendorffii]